MPGYSLELAERNREEDVEEEFLHVMVWYSDIRARALRGYHFEPIQLQEIEVYERFLAKLGLEMTAFDWDLIMRLDYIWMGAVPTDANKNDKSRPDQAATVH